MSFESSFEMPARYSAAELIEQGAVYGQQIQRLHGIEQILRNPRVINTTIGNLNLVASRVLGGQFLQHTFFEQRREGFFERSLELI